MKVPEHIRGDGPDRKLLPNYHRLGKMGEGPFKALCKAVEEQTLKCGAQHNDINDEQKYKIAQDCPLKTYFPSTYRQLLLQHSIKFDSTETEFDYIGYRGFLVYEKIGKTLEKFVPGFFRARIAILPPGEVLDWHIDSNTSYSCRIQFPIIGSCDWQIRRGKKVESKVLKPGEVWFTNTGFSHRVENTGTEDRVTIVVGCKFDDIKSRFSDEIISRS